MRGWNKMPATITHVELKCKRKRHGEWWTLYKCIVTYEYEVGGKTYVGDRVELSSSTDYTGFHRG